MTTNHSFEDIYQQNKRRIHYQICRLQLDDTHQEFFQEGLCAMWNAFERYDPDKGPMATYFNFTIRNRLLDLLRKETKYTQRMQIYLQAKLDEKPLQNEYDEIMPTTLESTRLWLHIQSQLTPSQCKWVYYAVMKGMSLKDIAKQENTTVDAVKGWGKLARKKLRTPEFRSQLLEVIRQA